MEICLFGSKININYQIKFTLNLRYIYLIHINHSFTPKIKHVIRRNVCFGKCQFGDVPFGELSLGKCPFGELSIWRIVPLRNRRLGNCPLGKCLWGTVHRRKVFWGKVRQGNVQILSGISCAERHNSHIKIVAVIFLHRNSSSAKYPSSSFFIWVANHDSAG